MENCISGEILARKTKSELDSSESILGEKSSKTVKPGDLKSLLGPALFPKDTFKSPKHPGIAQGLAWTPSGGSILNIEAIALQGEKAELKLTGQLGEVMQESSKIAHSLVRSILNEQKDNRIGLDQPVHLHVPEGATPKDGPSCLLYTSDAADE